MATEITEALRTILKSEGLSDTQRASAQRLITSLERPVRIAVVGTRGSGKTSVANMLVGGNVMPRTDGLTITETVWAAQEKITCEYSTGEIVSFDGVSDDFTLPEQAMRLRFALSDARLRQRSLTEICLSDQPGMARDLLDMIAPRTDILLWCSGAGVARAGLWQHLPDHLKDNSLFVITMADRLHAAGRLTTVLAQARETAGADFMGVYPLVAHRAGIAADAGDTYGILRRSGGQAILDDVARIIRLARQSDMIRAQALLDQISAAQTSVQGAIPDAAENALKNGLARLTAGSDCADRARVLTTCRIAVSDLVATLPADPPEGSGAVRLRAEAEDAAAYMQRFCAESTDSAARNAVALLLQLSRELSGRVYA
ncbi:hypothetical protein [uncultured Roseobacter sp.]|uniref:hypothetical protein n=1 Tax=uncultured Roseobacter sp. TaxID=114847 RepID=UPI002610606A|nr:hypothetical protein [uncultured Roseobacter sp.]